MGGGNHNDDGSSDRGLFTRLAGYAVGQCLPSFGACPPQGYSPQGYPPQVYPPTEYGYPPLAGYPFQGGYPPAGYPGPSAYPPPGGYPPANYPGPSAPPYPGYAPSLGPLIAVALLLRLQLMGPTSYHTVPIILPMEVTMVVKESLGSMEVVKESLSVGSL